MNREQVAKICHEAIRAYAIQFDGRDRGPWEEMDTEYQESYLTGVDYITSPEAMSAEERHAEWLENHLADAWVLGDERDDEKKTHPNMLPYEELPFEQRAKDAIFASMVTSLIALGKELDIEEAAKTPPPSKVYVGKMPIRYIGPRPQYTDGAYGTYITWNKGETKLVPEAAAYKMLSNNKDLYEAGSMDEASEPLVDVPNKKEEEEEEIEDTRESIMQMTRKKPLVEFAQHNFQVKLDDSAKVSDLQEKCIQLIDQYGMPE